MFFKDIFCQKIQNLPGVVVLVVCIIVCVTQDCGSTVVALDGVVVCGGGVVI